MSKDEERTMTDNEIIKALECCRDSVRNGSWKECLRCPAGSRKWELCDASRNCIDDIMTKNIALINHQKAKIEALQMENQQLQSDIANANMNADHALAEIERLKDKYECIYQPKAMIKAEAIKEFAERLKIFVIPQKADGYVREIILKRDIDNLVEEMVGDENERDSV